MGPGEIHILTIRDRGDCKRQVNWSMGGFSPTQSSMQLGGAVNS
jgi:hypothetical protein